MNTARVMTSGLQFPEGPIAMADGSVIVVEIKPGNITRCLPDGSKEVIAHVGGGPNGAAIGPDGNIYVCNNGGFLWREVEKFTAPHGTPPDYVTGSIQRVDMKTGSVETLYTECDGHKLCGPNDIVFDDQGGFYFTDLGKGRDRDSDHAGLYYAKADGSQIVSCVYPLTRANGVSLSPDNSWVYVAETTTARLWGWEIESPGVMKAATMKFAPGNLIYGFDAYQLLDSMATDGDGNICVATLMKSCISVVSPQGELIEQISLPEYDPYITNICFGGADMKTAYITSSGLGVLYEMQWPRAGLQLNHFA
jgi:gluconolactonase